MSNLVVQQENNVDPMLRMIERVALDPNADVSKLEKMIELQERVMANQAKQQFDQAMLNFQIKKPVIEKNAMANKTKYAKLPNIQAAAELMDSVDKSEASGKSKKDWVLAAAKHLILKGGRNWDKWEKYISDFIDAAKSIYNSLKGIF